VRAADSWVNSPTTYRRRFFIRANIVGVYIGSRRHRKRGNGAAWFILLVIGVILVGGYALVQQRLGNGLVFTPQSTAVIPQATPTRSVENFIILAEDAYKRGDYRGAINFYDQASRRKPNDASLLALAARLQVFIGQAPKAEQRALKALQLDANNAMAKAVLCMAIDWQGRYAEAVSRCTEATQLDPHSSMAFAYLAEAQTDGGDLTAGRASVQHALQLDPKNEDAMRDLAYTYEQSGDYGQAIFYYQKTLELNPNMPHVLISLGRCEVVMGQVPKAVLYYKHAIEVDPQNAEAYDRLGGAYFAIGEYDLARSALDKAIGLDPMRVTAFTRRGILNFQLRRYENSVADYTRALTTSKIVSATLTAVDYINYGFALQLTGDCSHAIGIFNQAAVLAPNDQDIQDKVAVGLKRCSQQR
jgi:superkiller protein 3